LFLNLFSVYGNCRLFLVYVATASAVGENLRPIASRVAEILGLVNWRLLSCAIETYTIGAIALSKVVTTDLLIIGIQPGALDGAFAKSRVIQRQFQSNR
jgi:hypothetical protein